MLEWQAFHHEASSCSVPDPALHCACVCSDLDPWFDQYQIRARLLDRPRSYQVYGSPPPPPPPPPPTLYDQNWLYSQLFILGGGTPSPLCGLCREFETESLPPNPLESRETLWSSVAPSPTSSDSAQNPALPACLPGSSFLPLFLRRVPPHQASMGNQHPTWVNACLSLLGCSRKLSHRS